MDFTNAVPVVVDMTFQNVGVGRAMVDTAYNYQQPGTGTTLTLNNTDWYVVIDPTGALLALTVQFCANPFDGQVVDVRTTQAITNLTIAPNAGQSVAVTGFTSLGASQKFSAIYLAFNNTWYVAG